MGSAEDRRQRMEAALDAFESEVKAISEESLAAMDANERKAGEELSKVEAARSELDGLSGRRADLRREIDEELPVAHSRALLDDDQEAERITARNREAREELSGLEGKDEELTGILDEFSPNSFRPLFDDDTHSEGRYRNRPGWEERTMMEKARERLEKLDSDALAPVVNRHRREASETAEKSRTRKWAQRTA